MAKAILQRFVYDALRIMLGTAINDEARCMQTILSENVIAAAATRRIRLTVLWHVGKPRRRFLCPSQATKLNDEIRARGSDTHRPEKHERGRLRCCC